MLKSIVCDYNDAYILLKVTFSVVGQRADAVAIAADRNNEELVFKKCALLHN